MSAVSLRPASTVVLLRPSSTRFDVLLVRRSDSVAFMGGAHVFPGGRVDSADSLSDVPAIADGSDDAVTALSDIEPVDAVAHHVAAVRELFEEAGILLARASERLIALDGESSDRFAAHRRALLEGNTSMVDIAQLEGLRLALDELTYFAHWVTPEIEIKRFDTRFFVARLPEGQTPLHDDTEITHSEWLDPAEAVTLSREGQISLPPPTWTTLSALAKFATVDEVVAWAKRRPVPRVQPRFRKDGDSTMLFYPGDPLYPAVEGFDTPEVTRFVLENRRWIPAMPE